MGRQNLSAAGDIMSLRSLNRASLRRLKHSTEEPSSYFFVIFVINIPPTPFWMVKLDLISRLETIEQRFILDENSIVMGGMRPLISS